MHISTKLDVLLCHQGLDKNALNPGTSFKGGRGNAPLHFELVG